MISPGYEYVGTQDDSDCDMPLFYEMRDHFFGLFIGLLLLNGGSEGMITVARALSIFKNAKPEP